jgi:hypothetical protein
MNSKRFLCQRLSQGKSLDWKYCRTVTGCNEINVMSLFNTIPRTKRSHGHKRIQHPNVKKSSKPRTLQDTFNDLDNGNRLIFEIWWNFFYDLFSIKNVADVNSIDSFVSKRNMEEFSVVFMKRFRSNRFEKTKGRHVTYNTTTKKHCKIVTL